MGIIREFIDFSSDGYIFIDENGKIVEYNDKAKEIFGIINKNSIGHDEGQIEKGDIVIIADNNLGFDDGNLDFSNLEILGLNENIKYGEGFIIIGKYDGLENAYFVKGNGDIQIKREYGNIKIESKIDKSNREILIKINELSFNIKYMYSFGHMIILGSKGKVKFYQERGYTARGESVKEILNGKRYIKKTPEKSLNVMGEKITDLHSGDIIKEFIEIAGGSEKNIKNKSININGNPLICDIFGTDYGAWMKIEDVSGYESLILSKEKVLRDLKNLQIKRNDKEQFEQIDFIGNSDKIVEVRKMAYRASKSDSNVVLLGASGTGKSLLARQIHANSRYSGNPFIEVNCSAVPDNLFESEFFGYEKGAFTGAKLTGKIGYFELANNGTLFLDEVADLPVNMQSKLLNVLQNKRFYKIGGLKETKVNFRLIVATNKNLKDLVEKNLFREDLYYRINVFPINIPTLKERKEDIRLLIDKIIPKTREKTFHKRLSISNEAINRLLEYNLPGNVRELENILERAANLIDDDVIDVGNLDFILADKENNLDLKKQIKKLEKKLLIEALKISNNDKKRAMALLNMKKTAFYEKLKKYNIDI